MTKLTFKVQLLKPVLWLLFFFFFFRWESPPNISGPSSSAWLRWWRTFCCSSVLSLLSCWHSLQVYPTSSIWLQVLIYCSDSRICVCDRVRKWIRKCRCAKLLLFRTPANVHCGKMCAMFVQEQINVCDVRMQPKSSLTRSLPLWIPYTRHYNQLSIINRGFFAQKLKNFLV